MSLDLAKELARSLWLFRPGTGFKGICQAFQGLPALQAVLLSEQNRMQPAGVPGAHGSLP